MATLELFDFAAEIKGETEWYAVCFGYLPREHCVGVNGDDELDAIRKWNRKVERQARRALAQQESGDAA